MNDLIKKVDDTVDSVFEYIKKRPVKTAFVGLFFVWILRYVKSFIKE